MPPPPPTFVVGSGPNEKSCRVDDFTAAVSSVGNAVDVTMVLTCAGMFPRPGGKETVITTATPGQHPTAQGTTGTVLLQRLILLLWRVSVPHCCHGGVRDYASVSAG